MYRPVIPNPTHIPVPAAPARAVGAVDSPVGNWIAFAIFLGWGAMVGLIPGLILGTVYRKARGG